MASAELSHRLGLALGTRTVGLAERDAVVSAAAVALAWDDLPPEVQAIVEDIEGRPGWVDAEGA